MAIKKTPDRYISLENHDEVSTFTGYRNVTDLGTIHVDAPHESYYDRATTEASRTEHEHSSSSWRGSEHHDRTRAREIAESEKAAIHAYAVWEQKERERKQKEREYERALKEREEEVGIEKYGSYYEVEKSSVQATKEKHPHSVSTIFPEQRSASESTLEDRRDYAKYSDPHYGWVSRRTQPAPKSKKTPTKKYRTFEPGKAYHGISPSLGELKSRYQLGLESRFESGNIESEESEFSYATIKPGGLGKSRMKYRL